MGDDAVSIYQAHIDALSDTFLRRDHHAFSGRMSFPHTMILDDQAVVTPDAETSFHNLTEYAMTFQSQRVTEFIRLCSGAHFVTPTRMEGTHVSHMLSGATRLSAPYANRLRLELINGVWLETAASNAIRRANALSSLPVASDAPQPAPLPLFAPERTRT